MTPNRTHDVREFVETELLRVEKILTGAENSPPSILLEANAQKRLLMKILRIWDGVEK